jgi:hypothetical protein
MKKKLTKEEIRKLKEKKKRQLKNEETVKK